jgi:hypothetical protein
MMVRSILVSMGLSALAMACSASSNAPAAPAPGASDADAAPGCENRGDTYYAGLKKASTDGLVNIELTAADPAPPSLGDTNTWTLKLTGADGTPLDQATITGAPWMPDHQHGSPLQIAVGSGSGAYKIASLEFIMDGLWQVTLKVTPPGSTVISEVPFSFCIQPN